MASPGKTAITGFGAGARAEIEHRLAAIEAKEGPLPSFGAGWDLALSFATPPGRPVLRHITNRSQV